MDAQIDKTWKSALADEYKKDYFQKLSNFVNEEYKSNVIFPSLENIFNALNSCPVNSVKVVILGQDPYHGVGQAHGLSFSVQDNAKIPPSLRNIYKEIESNTGAASQTGGDLSAWAEQGVLLLNATLTVREGQPGSHQGKGWEKFTDAVVKYLSNEKDGIVFLLWGRYAQEKGNVIDTKKHLVVTAAHPSPFSAHNGFFGCKHFSKTNRYLKEHKKDAIIW